MPVLVDTPVTAGALITRAMRLMGQIEAGQSPTVAEYADGLIALNGLVDGFRTEKLMLSATRAQSVALAPTVAAYTIGPGGTLNTDRPVQIDGAYVVDSQGISHAVQLITDIEYASIPLKTNPGPWPDRLYYQASVPIGTMRVYPVPDQVSTLHILTWEPLNAFANISDTMSLAPGWYDLLAMQLAVNWCAEFEREPLQHLVENCRRAKANIKRANAIPVVAGYDPSLIGDGGWYDWRSGGPP